MPLYEYKCQCGKTFEAIMSIDLRHEAHCPDCGRLARKKLSLFYYTFGFTLSDESRWTPYRKDELVRNI